MNLHEEHAAQIAWRQLELVALAQEARTMARKLHPLAPSCPHAGKAVRKLVRTSRWLRKLAVRLEEPVEVEEVEFYLSDGPIVIHPDDHFPVDENDLFDLGMTLDD